MRNFEFYPLQPPVRLPLSRSFNRRQFIALAGAAGIGLVAPNRQAAVIAQDDGLTERLDAAVRAYVERDQFAGAVLVTRGGEPLLRTAYGPANRTTDEPNTPETGYQIASLTKAFTALACVQLQEAGKLSLDDPITRFLPEVTTRSWMVSRSRSGTCCRTPRACPISSASTTSRTRSPTRTPSISSSATSSSANWSSRPARSTPTATPATSTPG